MGANALWWIEYLCQAMELHAGMRVLDLGCGKALTSIFLARELGVQVWAADPWVSPTDNLRRVRGCGVEHLVYPLTAEAHSLPFGEGFFDAVVSINAYQFFGTDETYLSQHLLPLVRPGGQIGVVVPGLLEELGGPVPEHLRPYWQPDFFAWHTPEWWRAHWEKTGLVAVEFADAFPDGDGWRLWLLWQEVMGRVGLLRADQGRYISFVRVVARVPEPPESRASAKCPETERA
jgi:cyclopropane fatty-acyl-phospholipid synthase-like methyltransferase